MPDTNFLSSPLWLINSLHWLTFSLHLISMNFLFGGLMMVLWNRFTGQKSDPTVQSFIKLFPSIMAFTVSLGVAPLLFLQLVYPQQAYSAAITSGWLWLGVVIAAIIGYYLFYSASFAANERKEIGRWLLPGAMLCLLYISFTYSSIFSMAERPALMASVYAQNQSGLALNPDVSEYIFRWLHMIIGALSVGGFFFAWLGRHDLRAFTIGKQVFIYGSVVNMVIGLIYLFGLGDFLLPFMRSPGIHALTLGIVTSLAMLHFVSKKRFTISALLLLLTMLSMVIARHYVRLVRLAESYNPAELPVEPQWLMIILFVFFFLLALATLYYMLRVFLKSKLPT